MKKCIELLTIGAVAILSLAHGSSFATAATHAFPFGGLTVVEAEPFAFGGTAGNTTAVGGTFFSDPSVATNTLTWRDRAVSAFVTDYENVAGTTDRIFDEINAGPELVTTVSGLAASTYEVSVVYMYAQNDDTSAGLLANLYGSTNSAFDRQFYDRSEVDVTIGSPTPGIGTWAIGIASLGTTAAGSTSFTVDIGLNDDLGGGVYGRAGYIGVAYQAVADLPTLPTPAGFINAAEVIYGGAFNAADSTEKLQAALDTGLDVFVPNMGGGMDWITDRLFLTNDNQTIRFEDGVVVEAKMGGFDNPNASLFEADGVTGVTLSGYGATFSMNDIDSATLGGEFRHAIDLTSVTDFRVEGLTINNAAGDGIYVDGSFGVAGAFSDGVTIEDVIIDGSYRNGISVISAEDLLIDNAVIVHTSGTAPESGIVFEPDNVNQRVVNAIVRNSVIEGNLGHGIAVVVSDATQAMPVSILLENNTIAGNTEDGVRFNEGAITGVVLRDNIVVDNGLFGINNLINVGTVTMTNSAISGNGTDLSAGASAPGVVTEVPVFLDPTDPTNPLYYFLDPATSTLVSLGDSDGSFIGARGVAGDFNADADITGFDFLQWQRGNSPNNGSASDLAAWEMFFGATGAPLSGLAAGVGAVPEPSSAVLLSLALAGLAASRRRRK